jgi:nitrate/nitrite transporter NarK
VQRFVSRPDLVPPVVTVLRSAPGTAPGLLFLPLGGLVADRGNPRRLLLRYHMLYAAPPLVLAVVLMEGGLSYPLLIAYGLAAEFGRLETVSLQKSLYLLAKLAADHWHDRN